MLKEELKQILEGENEFAEELDDEDLEAGLGDEEETAEGEEAEGDDSEPSESEETE